jgi:hypothetical protein
VAAAALVVGAVLAPGVARAQPGTPQAQFDFGLAEMEAGRYASGCPALAESYRLDPRPGVLFTLAECENRWGKIASALTHYEAYIDVFARMRDDEKAHQRGRDKVALTQRNALRVQVPELAIAVPASAPPGTTVSRDGVPLGAPSLGVPLTVDPGEHVVVARTPDGVPHETRVTVSRGEHRALVVDLSTPAPAPAPASAPAPTPASAHTWALAAGAAGLAAVALGVIGGSIVLDDKSTIDDSCNPDRPPRRVPGEHLRPRERRRLRRRRRSPRHLGRPLPRLARVALERGAAHRRRGSPRRVRRPARRVVMPLREERRR